MPAKPRPDWLLPVLVGAAVCLGSLIGFGAILWRIGPVPDVREAEPAAVEPAKPKPPVVEPQKLPPPPRGNELAASADARRIAANPWFQGRCSATAIDAIIDRANRLAGVLVVYDQDGRVGITQHRDFKSDIIDLWAEVIGASSEGGDLERFGVWPDRDEKRDFRVLLVPRLGVDRETAVKLLETSLVSMSYSGFKALQARTDQQILDALEEAKKGAKPDKP